METVQKIYAVTAVVVLGGALYLSFDSRRDHATVPAAAAHHSTRDELPKIALTKSDAEQVTKIELTRPDDDDPARLRTITLEKLGEVWEITTPLRTQASTSKVDELIHNLQNLRLSALIDRGTTLYEQFELTNTKALHFIAWKGSEKVCELYCGKSRQQGQLARVPGRDGIFSLVNRGSDGYQGFLYTRDLRSWRETTILKFAPSSVLLVEIANAHGGFLFTQTEDKWTGSYSKRLPNGSLAKPERDWKYFDASQVNELVRAYSSLSAEDFGEERDRAESGVDNAEMTGGVVRIRLRDSAPDLTIRVGKPSTNATRFSVKDSRWAVKDGGDGTLYVLSPWTADWALATPKLFEKVAK
jgi:hypothetical protein